MTQTYDDGYSAGDKAGYLRGVEAGKGPYLLAHQAALRWERIARKYAKSLNIIHNAASSEAGDHGSLAAEDGLEDL